MIKKLMAPFRSRVHGSMKPSFFRVGCLVVASVAVASVIYQPAGAVIQREYDYNQGNAVERQYIRPAGCSTKTPCYRAGVWLASPGTDYKSTTVNVPYGQTVVDVEIRGSWSAQPTQRGPANSDYKGVYANLETDPSKVHDVTGGGRSRGDDRLYGFSGSKFYRGDRQRNTTPWFIRNTDGKVQAKFRAGTICAGKEGQSLTTDALVGSKISYTFFSKGGDDDFGSDVNYDRTRVTITCGQNPAYSLTPATSMNTAAVPIGAGSLGVSARITKSGAASPAVNNAYAILARFVVKADKVPGMQKTGGEVGGGNGSVVVQYIHSHYLDTADAKYTSWNTDVNYRAGQGVYQPSNYAGITDDISQLWNNGVGLGDQICYVTFVNKFANDKSDNDWRGDAPKCAVVAKSPKLSVTGGDAQTSADADTSSLQLAGTTYGSWVEYGTFLNGVNTGGNFGSGASLRNGTTVGAGVPRNQLTFANSSSTFGKFGGPTTGQSTLDSAMAGLLPRAGSITNGSYDVAGLASGRYDSTAGTFSLHGSNIRNSVVINAPNATITIDGNLQYAGGTPASADAIPQLVIIAKNITIAPSVSRVDGWLLAKTSLGTLTTCNGYTKTSTNKASLFSACNTPLTVNGPATAKNGDFYRVAGSDDKDSQKNTAETFNLPADSYIWQYRQASKNIVPTTVQVTELPVRY